MAQRSGILQINLNVSCRYVRSANENIAAITDKTILFKEMVSNQDYLPELLLKLGIVVHPLLARELFNEAVNKNKDEPIPPLAKWKTEDQDFAKNILFGDMSAHKEIELKAFKKVKTPNWKKTNAKNLNVIQSLKSVSFSAIDPEKPAHIVFYGSSWHKRKNGGIDVEKNQEYEVKISSTGNTVRVFIIGYGEDNTALEQQEVFSIRKDDKHKTFAFANPNSWHSFSVSLFANPDQLCGKFNLQGFEVKKRVLFSEYVFSP